MPVEQYRMYIDECGTDDVVNTHDPRYQHLALTGVICSVRYMRHELAPALDEFKRRHFPDHDPDGPPLVLHRSDFLAGKGAFHALQNTENLERFTTELCDLVANLEHRVITVALDKHVMLSQAHWQNKEPYHYCAEVLGEKFVQYLERVDGVGDIYAESRKQKKNTALANAFKGVFENGTRFVSSARFSQRLTTSEIKFRDKHDDNAGLQLADIYAKPSFDRIMRSRSPLYERKDFSVRIGNVLVAYLYDRGNTNYVEGYGMKYIG